MCDNIWVDDGRLIDKWYNKQFQLSTIHDLEATENKVPMKDCLHQFDYRGLFSVWDWCGKI